MVCGRWRRCLPRTLITVGACANLGERLAGAGEDGTPESCEVRDDGRGRVDESIALAGGGDDESGEELCRSGNEKSGCGGDSPAGGARGPVMI